MLECSFYTCLINSFETFLWILLTRGLEYINDTDINNKEQKYKMIKKGKLQKQSRTRYTYCMSVSDYSRVICIDTLTTQASAEYRPWTQTLVLLLIRSQELIDCFGECTQTLIL